jgi:hypothetical protein
LIAGHDGIGIAPASVRFPDERAGILDASQKSRYIEVAEIAEVVKTVGKGNKSALKIG